MSRLESEIRDLLKQVDEIAEMKGRRRNVLRKHWRRALRVMDADSQQVYASHNYKYGAGKTHHRRRGGRFRDFAAKAAAYKYQWTQTKKYSWRYRSMMKRKGWGDNYQGNLSHLLEDGAYNKMTRRMNRPALIRRGSFRRKKSIMQKMVITGIERALSVSP